MLIAQADGSFVEVATGLMTGIGVALGPYGALYVSQLATLAGKQPGPGNVVRIGADGAAETVVDGVPFAHGTAFDADGNVYVVAHSTVFGPPANEPAGQVWRCDGVGAAQYDIERQNGGGDQFIVAHPILSERTLINAIDRSERSRRQHRLMRCMPDNRAADGRAVRGARAAVMKRRCTTVMTSGLEPPTDWRRSSTIAASRAAHCVQNRVWFLFEEGQLLLSVKPDTQKYRNLRRDPHLALSCLDLADAGRYVELRGVVIAFELYEDLTFVNRLARKYTGADFTHGHVGEQRYKLTVQIDAWTAQG